MSQNLSAHIGGIAIRLAITTPRFSVEDVQKEASQNVNKKDVENVLAQLKADGWIEETNSQLFLDWQSGPLAREYGDMVKFSKDSEGRIPVLPDERNPD